MLRAKIVWLIVILAVAGLVLSGYLTWYGFTTSVGVCPLTGPFGCSAVLTSVYSKIGMMPVAVLGVVWFLVAALIGILLSNDEKWLKHLLVWSVIGLVGIASLEYVQIFLVGQICVLCVSSHVFGLAILVLTAGLWLTKGK